MTFDLAVAPVFGDCGAALVANLPDPTGPSAWIDFPSPALFGAWRPPLGTEIRSMVEARGLPCSIGLKVPDPLSDRPGLPLAKLVAAWPGITCAIWPDLKSATSTCPRLTSTRVLPAFTVTLNCVPFTTAAR